MANYLLTAALVLLRAFFFLALTAVLGCEQFASEQDKSTKQKVVGHWLREVDSEVEGRLVREHIVHSADGKFLLDRLVASKDGVVTREQESGSWFITANLYKMRTEFAGREALPPPQQLYATCTITLLSAQELVCSNEMDKWTKRQTRVPDDFRL